MKLSSIFASAVAAVVCSILACGDGDPSSSGAVGAPTIDGGPCAPSPAPQKPQASCDVTITLPPIERTAHVPEGTTITYCSNPPSSGLHYPVWAAFQEYERPVDWPYLVHSMEHGAVLLLYKCEPAGCPEIVEQLRKVRDAAPIDPACAGQPSPRRIVLAPSTTIETKVAAAAWGATYQADCVDAPTLDAFIRDHYAKGPEDFCSPGRTF